MKIEFVYRPKSGDRVFVETAMSGMAVLHGSNGCRHAVLADAVPVLRYSHASRAWREVAGKLIEAVVAQAGGLAWDAQGELTVVVAPPLAWSLATALTHLANVSGGPWGVNPQLPETVGLELFRAGLSRVDLHRREGLPLGTFGFAPQRLGNLELPELMVGEPTESERPKPDGEEGETVRVTSVPVTDGHETVTVTAPWSLVTVTGKRGEVPRARW